ncbi:MAG: Sec-independent protein translocase protein TatB [Actinomycetota bacterium]
MLNIGGWELMIILLVALIFLGPQRLPEVARQVGQTVNTLRGLARGFQAELEAAARPDPLPAAGETLAPGPDETTTSAEDAGGGDDSGETGDPGTDVEELAAKAREMSTSASADDAVPVSPGGPTDLRSDEEE